jgi:hypothetical protein
MTILITGTPGNVGTRWYRSSAAGTPVRIAAMDPAWVGAALSASLAGAERRFLRRPP